MPGTKPSTTDNDGRYGEPVAPIGPLQTGQVLGSAGSRMKVFVSGYEVHTGQVFFRPAVLKTI